MAYPFAPMPTLREFVEKALTYGVTDTTSKRHVTGPRGEETFRYLRKGDGPIVILTNIAEDERLTPVVLSNLCRQLDLPPADFGLTSGFVQDPFDS